MVGTVNFLSKKGRPEAVIFTLVPYELIDYIAIPIHMAPSSITESNNRKSFTPKEPPIWQPVRNLWNAGGHQKQDMLTWKVFLFLE